ncbi:hypothetical protein OROMI_004902 [Orobanche minor]
MPISGLIKYEDESPADAKGMGQKMLDQVYEIYNSDLSRKGFPYDGEKSLFSVGPIPHYRLEFTMVLADASPDRGVGTGTPGADGSPGGSDLQRSRRQPYLRTCKVVIIE